MRRLVLLLGLLVACGITIDDPSSSGSSGPAGTSGGGGGRATTTTTTTNATSVSASSSTGCHPIACSGQLGDACGVSDDGCGHEQVCACDPGFDCGAQTPGVCGSTGTGEGGNCPCGGPNGECPCSLCQSMSLCGVIQSDSCQVAVMDCTACDVCAPGEVCGQDGYCAGCIASSCADLGPATCGTVGDGCGGVLDCGTCMRGTTCDGGGVPNQCGCPTSATCAEMGATCGEVPDGCGGLLDCGTCMAPETCGGGGVFDKCG